MVTGFLLMFERRKKRGSALIAGKCRNMQRGLYIARLPITQSIHPSAASYCRCKTYVLVFRRPTVESENLPYMVVVAVFWALSEFRKHLQRCLNQKTYPH